MQNDENDFVIETLRRSLERRQHTETDGNSERDPRRGYEEKAEDFLINNFLESRERIEKIQRENGYEEEPAGHDARQGYKEHDENFLANAVIAHEQRLAETEKMTNAADAEKRYRKARLKGRAEQSAIQAVLLLIPEIILSLIFAGMLTLGLVPDFLRFTVPFDAALFAVYIVYVFFISVFRMEYIVDRNEYRIINSAALFVAAAVIILEWEIKKELIVWTFALFRLFRLLTAFSASNFLSILISFIIVMGVIFIISLPAADGLRQIGITRLIKLLKPKIKKR